MDEITVEAAPVRRVISFSKNPVAPRVADMSRKRDRAMVSSGTCHATPREASE